MARIRKDFSDLRKELEETKERFEKKKQQEATDIYNFLSKEFKTNKLDFESFKYWFKSLNKEDKKTLKEIQIERKNKTKEEINMNDLQKQFNEIYEKVDFDDFKYPIIIKSYMGSVYYCLISENDYDFIKKKKNLVLINNSNNVIESLEFYEYKLSYEVHELLNKHILSTHIIKKDGIYVQEITHDPYRKTTEVYSEDLTKLFLDNFSRLNEILSENTFNYEILKIKIKFEGV